ncbi:hypothetical protein AJ88_12680 [Mesorhizobium amorphae CCBAU 01583]|nr:hypothetical protein AJ88_12680 [Mesorhizobium amorphae CCBAU 01583]
MVVRFFAILWIAFLTKTTSTFSRGSLTLAFAVGFPILLPGHLALARVLKRLLAAEKLVLRTAYLFYAGVPGMEQGIIGKLGQQGIAVCGVSKIENRNGMIAAQSVRAGVAAAQAAFRFDPYGAVYLFCSWDQRKLIKRTLEECPACRCRSIFSLTPTQIRFWPDVPCTPAGSEPSKSSARL